MAERRGTRGTRRPQRRVVDEASYDEASRVRYRDRRHDARSGEEAYDARMRVVVVMLAVVAVVVALKLVYLQVVKGSEYSAAAESARTNVVTLHARRGTIYDRDGNILAMSVDCQTIYCNPGEVHDPSAIADILVDELGGSKSTYMGSLTEDTTFVYLARQVDQDVADGIEQQLADADLTGVYFLDDVKREYPYGDVAGQVLGLVDADGNGQSGLELYYDDVLSGTDGSMILETGLTGTPIAGGVSEVTPAEDGRDIVISLDIDVQRVAEETIVAAVEEYGAESGSVMVEDPTTGEVIAACSTPLATVTDRSTLDVEGLSLKLVSDSFEPGSVFKVITLGIGLEDGLFDADTSYYVPWRVLTGDDYVYDWDGRTYDETLTVRQILERSSNTGTATLVQDVIGAERFAEGVEAFGIGQLTGIDYPGETAGIVRSLDEYDGSTAGQMSFGQGVAIPMVQIVRAYAAVANDGVALTPHFLLEAGGVAASWDESERILSEDVAAELADIMLSPVYGEDGTGTAAQMEGYVVAGKTGTGEQASDDEAGYETSYVSSFCGFVNADDPQMLVYVGLNGTAYHSYAAATLFPTIMQEAVSDLGIAPAE